MESPLPLALSVVVPCYNEELVLHRLEERLRLVCAEVAASSYELIFVNDGSTDATWPLIQRLSRLSRRVVGVNLSRNFGQQKALSAGLSLARGRRVLTLDADLQDPPELLPQMMALMNQGADVVYGQRTQRRGDGWFKRASAALFYRIFSRLSDLRLPRDSGDFRLMQRPAVDAFLQMPEESRFVRGMVAWLGFTQVPMHYTRQARHAGSTAYPLRKMLGLAMDAITSFSTVPLRFALWLGVGSLAVSAGLGFYALGSWLFYDMVHGWSSLAAIVIGFSATQLLTLGLIGEYVARIYLQVKNRPLFLIKEVVGRAPKGTQFPPRAVAAARAPFTTNPLLADPWPTEEE